MNFRQGLCLNLFHFCRRKKITAFDWASFTRLITEYFKYARAMSHLKLQLFAFLMD